MAVSLRIDEITQEKLEEMHSVQERNVEYDLVFCKEISRKEIVAFHLKHEDLRFVLQVFRFDPDAWVDTDRVAANVRQALAGRGADFDIPRRMQVLVQGRQRSGIVSGLK